VPVNLSIKNVPDALARQLRRRAARAQRSLQRELLVILQEAVAPQRRLTAAGVLRRLQALSVRTGAESTAIVRAARDGR
jgi:plasmid stability protein